jgi:hypothetical protein
MGSELKSGDDLVIQLESGYCLLRILAISEQNGQRIWHLSSYEELFPDVESAEAALKESQSLHLRIPHMALTERAFERTPVAVLGHRPVSESEVALCKEWFQVEGQVSDRSAILMMGLR